MRRLFRALLLVAFLIACRQGWRHYQVTKKLQESLAELDRTDPGWRLEDIEAAREQIPEEENSARVVVAAAKLLPKDWPSAEFIDRFKNLLPEVQLPPDDFAALKQELHELQQALKEARKLADMPRGRHRILYERLVYETVIEDQVQTRRISQLLHFDAMRQVQEAEMGRALLDCLAGLNAARSIGDEPIALSQLSRMACVMNTCQSVERALAQGQPVQKLALVQSALEGEDSFSDLLVLARGERAALHGTFDAIESGDVPLSKLEGAPSRGKDFLLGWFARDQFREAHTGMLEYMTRFVDIARRPMHEQAVAERELGIEVREQKASNPLAVIYIPALQRVGDACRRKHAYLRCTAVALAAERFRRERGAWPGSIEQMCPQYLAAVPLDPFDGRPLRYRRLEDGVVVYSVGPDGVDDDGNLDRGQPLRPGSDVGFRLWDVAKRRQPPRAR